LFLIVAALYLGDYIYCNTIAYCDPIPVNQSPEAIATVTTDQYQAALQDIDSGNYDMASKRLEYIISLDPEIFSAWEKLNEIQLLITPTPTLSTASTPEPKYLTDKDEYDDSYSFPRTAQPNLWSDISPDKITLYPYRRLNDYVIDKQGGFWAVGGFGILHLDANGQETWYNLKNGLSRQYFTSIAISPTGEVWAGGTENALFHFDGEKWMDEGEKLPPPYDDGSGWLCYSENISGIDFGPDGETWVMNNGLELYYQVNGHWANFPFPKHLLPMAGGGACPQDMIVTSINDIKINMTSFFPFGYQFDGQTWYESPTYEAVNKIIKSRQQTNDPYINEFIFGLVKEIPVTYPPELSSWMPFASSPYFLEPIHFTNDEDENLVIEAEEKFYRFSSNGFREIPQGLEPEDIEEPEIAQLLETFPGDRSYGIQIFADGSAWVSSSGTIWEYQDDHWQQYILPNASLTFTHFTQIDDGTIYGVSGEDVYQFQDTEILHEGFGIYWRKGFTFSSDYPTEECDYSNRDDASMTDCFSMFTSHPDYQFEALYLETQADGSVIFINNHLIARLDDGEWRSFFFDTLTFTDAAVDKDGNIWLYAELDGLLRLDPDVFDDYRGVPKETE
jgi:hypothetical protein